MRGFVTRFFLDELRMRGTANSWAGVLPLVARGESDTG